MADTRELEIVLNAKDNASAKIQAAATNAQSSMAQIGNAVKSAGDSMANFGKGLTTWVTLPSIGMGYAFTKAAGDLEQAKVSFEVMTGSAEKASLLLSQLSDFARTTPFDLPQVIEGSRRLMAYGTTAEDVIPTFKALGDIAAGVGTDKLPQLITAFGQVQAKTRLTGEELRQFTEAGVPLLRILAEQAGVSVGEMQDKISAGAVSFDDMKKAIFSMSQEGGMFFNLMERQSKTFTGVMSNIHDSIIRVSYEIMGLSTDTENFGEVIEGGAFDILKQQAEKALSALEKLGQWFKELSFETKRTVVNMLVLAAAMGPVIMVVGKIVSVIGSLITVLSSVNPVILIVAAVIGVFIGIIKLFQKAWQENWGGFRDSVMAAWDKIKPALNTLWQWLKVHIPQAVEWMKQKWEQARPVFEKFFNLLGQFARAVAPYVVMAIDKLVKIGNRIAEEYKKHPEIWNTLAKILAVVGAILLGVIVAGWIATAAVIGVVILVVAKLIEWIAKAANWVYELGFKAGYTAAMIVAWFQQLPGRIAAVFMAIWSFIVGIFNAIVGFIGGIIGRIGSIFWGVVGAASNAFNSVYNAIAGALSNAWNFVVGIVDRIKSKLSEIGGSISSAVSSLNPFKQQGGYIWETGAYVLHKGEQVIPAYTTNNEYANNPRITINVPERSTGSDLAWETQRKLERANYGALWR